MTEEKRKRRPKGVAALGDIHQTKVVAEAMIRNEGDERRKKSERLRALRLSSNGPGKQSSHT